MQRIHKMSVIRRWLCVASLVIVGCGDCDDNNPQSENNSTKDMKADQVSDMSGADMMDMSSDADMIQMATVCSERKMPSDVGAQVNATINGWSISVDGNTGAWQVGEMSAPPVCVEEDGQWVSTVRVATGDLTYKELFGSYRFDLKAPSLTWLPISGEVTVRSTADEVVIAYGVHGQVEPLELVIGKEGDRDVRVSMRTSLDVSMTSWSTTCDETEGFFGLGSQTYGMTLRGGAFPLWTQEHGIGKPEDGGFFPINNIPEAAHAPMGIWHSSKGYTAIVTHDGLSFLDLCKAHDTRTSLMSYKQMPGLVLVGGGSVLERLSNATSSYLGRPPEPPPWVFAPWNDAVGGTARLKEVAKILRENNVPSSAIWAEDWIGGRQTATGYRLSYAWEWDPMAYPTLPEDIRELHADGFAFLGYFNTFVPKPTRMFQEGTDNGYLIKNAEGDVYTFQDPAFRDASLVDLTNPAARAWFKGYMVKAAGELEIDGWMADFSEWLPIDSVLHSGEDALMYHNLYPVNHQQVTKEAMEQVHPAAGEAAYDWTFYARSGWASINGGSPSQTATMWGADQDTDWDYDDGYPTIVPIGANLGLSGVPFFGSDVAGYTSIKAPNTTKELFYRWSMVGAFHPVMRTHHGSDECGNWSFDRDMETLAHYRRYASIHTLLYPYLRMLMREALTRGWPMIRHPFVYSSSPEMWSGKDYAYFLGERLLIAPVLSEGATSREVAVPSPAAQWWPLFGAAPGFEAIVMGEGVDRVSIDAGVTELPVLVKPGTVLPLLSDVVASFYGATQANVTDLDDVENQYKLGVYFDAQGALSETTFGEEGSTVTVTGETWATALDWASATLDNQPLVQCDTATPTVSCVGGDFVKVIGQSGTVRIPHLNDAGQSASLVFNAQVPVTLSVYVGGAVFGALAEPTPVTDLNPDIKPPCEASE